VFNAWKERDWFGRAAEGATDFERLNRRMHNKQMIVDNRVAIIGGRNIGNEYVGLNGEFNFHDLDVLGVGPVARQASAVFDRYWNSEWVGRIPPPGDTDTVALTPDMIELPPAAAAHPAMKALVAGARSWAGELAALPESLTIGRSVVHTDSPSRAADARNHVPEAFRALMRSARREVLITNAYIIPDENFMSDLRELGGRGVRVRILTNSLASHDVPAVNAHYEGWRGDILRSGATLYEFRQDPAIKEEFIDTAPVRSGFAGLHTKAMVIDRERSFVGSMNLDPRSEVFNSEMGVIIDSAPLAEVLARRMERDMEGANSWQVTLAPDGTLRWKSDAGERTTQPARNFWQRLEDVFFKFFPSSYY
jgi:putative cardiolipin synthase